MKALLTLLACLAACDPAVDEVQPRGEDIYGPGCEYSWPIIWNEDYVDSPAECVMKSALCVDTLVQHCNDDPEGCYVTWNHCVDVYGACLKGAI